MDPAPGNRTNDVAAGPMVIVQTGPCGSQTPVGSGDLECDSNDLEGELVIFYLLQSNNLFLQANLLFPLFASGISSL